MGSLFIPFVYLMFLLSGAAALIYQVVWVRSLGLVFGGTHLAVTTVLAVFMGGLALGSFLIGRRVDAMRRPLRVYGWLELGIAGCALAFLGLMKIYPVLYAFLVDGDHTAHWLVSLLRVLFAFLALIVPTTLMGGTLPVLTRFVTRSPYRLGAGLSVLYGINTLGAAVGTAAASFFLVRDYGVQTAALTAVGLNVLLGLVCLFVRGGQTATATAASATGEQGASASASPAPEAVPAIPDAALRMVVIGIGISGFCALGYEILWTRILTLSIGTSVYGFATMLIAFLVGIALGSEAFGLVSRTRAMKAPRPDRLILGFGLVQIVIGLLALAVTYAIRDLPAQSIAFAAFFADRGLDGFEARQWGNLTLAFSYMLAPAFFMGVAFPLAGAINGLRRHAVGRSVGDVLTANTIGAILGSAVSGFALIYVFGIERSLQMLTLVNIGCGLLVMAGLQARRSLRLATAALVVAALGGLAASDDALRMWNRDYFAIFQNNVPQAYDTPAKLQDAIDNTEVLFHHEGIHATISTIKVKGGTQSVLVNGKIVASDTERDRQCQYTLGHLPMLVHPDPRRALVVGLGTGMTLGAVSVHPGLEELTLAEIEPHVVGAARAFGHLNHAVLDNPLLQVVFNDGRNYLMTTRRRFDVITADPIHPWTQGSGYLYTAEYFRLAADRLRPGGIMCQWLPIYEMSVPDLQSVVATFAGSFAHTMLWMTQYDAEIIGSNSPFEIDPAELARRVAVPSVAADLGPVLMGSAQDFLSYFVMGTDGMQAFGAGARLNTDDNLFLEYSAPVSVGRNVTGANIAAIARYREPLLPYLVSPSDNQARADQAALWSRLHIAAGLADRARSLLFSGHENTPEFGGLMAELRNRYGDFAPGRFIEGELGRKRDMAPVLVGSTVVMITPAAGQAVPREISALLVRTGPGRAAAVFVENSRRDFLGQRYFDGEEHEVRLREFAAEVLAAIRRDASGRGVTPMADLEPVRELVQDYCGP